MGKRARIFDGERTDFACAGGVASGDELVAAGLGHQELGVGGIFLDLLAQPVNVGLKRVGGDAGIVAPNLVQQRLARDHAIAGPVEILEDPGLHLGQPNLVAPFGEQELGGRLECVGSDGKNRVLALLVLTQLRADAREQRVLKPDLRRSLTASRPSISGSETSNSTSSK